jgi:glycosyltransferase involved in cell wall biosynthesis
MNQYPVTALLISTYNWPEALELVLQSVLLQKTMPAEVLIADDGSDERTALVIERFKNKSVVPIKHIWHHDDGFRKTIIINKAIVASDCEYIIQIDGDIIMHPDFIHDHLTEAEKGFYIKGSRTLLNQERSNNLLKKKRTAVSVFNSGIKNRINAFHIPILSSLLRNKSWRSDDWRGCNCAFWKEDFVRVNGYNNNLFGWGHEDIELAARFVNVGVMQKRIKLKAVCFHLYHKPNDKGLENKNFNTYQKVVEDGVVWAVNGLNEHDIRRI